jgi:GNAT superfamily N-acetyltransferase
VADPLLDHLRALGTDVAGMLEGRPVQQPGLTGFVSSDHDRFLNQLFAAGPVAASDVLDAFRGRPGFVWLREPGPEAEGLVPLVMHGMTASTSGAGGVADDVTQVRSPADLDAWHAVYCEVFEGDMRSRAEWGRLHQGLRGRLVLLLARVHGSPAATGAVYLADEWAGLYCFTTRTRYRRRGLASALVRASHAVARARGVEQALLHATPMGRSVYVRAGYEEVRPLPLLLVR